MMNVTEIRKLIRNSEEKALLRSLSVTIKYTAADFEIELTGLDVVFQFFKKQFEFFNSIDPLPRIFDASKEHFEDCIVQIERFVSNYIQEEYEREYLENRWSNLSSSLSLDVFRSNPIFNKESATTDFLLKLESEFEDASIGARDFLADTDFRVKDYGKNYFIGWHRAYEYFTQDADLVKRRNNEHATLSKVRSEYVKRLENVDSQVAEKIANVESDYDDAEKKLSRLIGIKNAGFEKWVKGSKTVFADLVEASNNTLADLESLYKEKLKLEAPAKYWKDRALKLRKEGDRWMYWLIGVTIVAVLLLGAVLFFISDGTLKELFEKTGSAVRWSIVFITFVSFLAYGIRTFAKLMFSAYHLHRDAEEREQLAYVYLALKKEKGIDETERHLIMQSLFSRADSGLLKDDSSPTMPGGSVIEKLMGGGK